MNIWAPYDQSGELRGRALRYLLVKILKDAGRPLTVQELIARCADEGALFDGRPSKIISDALRWERAAGRVKRLRRGLYSFGRAPRSTMQWIARRVEQVRCWLAWCRAQREPVYALDAAQTAAEPWDLSRRSWVPDWPGWGRPGELGS